MNIKIKNISFSSFLSLLVTMNGQEFELARIFGLWIKKIVRISKIFELEGLELNSFKQDFFLKQTQGT